ncbi:hypothetical protein [Acinetobacter guillouiae]|nr:hypothetical protein [Acinetobacter guillouiae]
MMVFQLCVEQIDILLTSKPLLGEAAPFIEWRFAGYCCKFREV